MGKCLVSFFTHGVHVTTALVMAVMADVFCNTCRAVSKRLVPTNVDMYRMYRNRDMLLQRRSDSPSVPRAAFDTLTPDQMQHQLLMGGSYVLRTLYRFVRRRITNT